MMNGTAGLIGGLAALAVAAGSAGAAVTMINVTEAATIYTYDSKSGMFSSVFGGFVVGPDAYADVGDEVIVNVTLTNPILDDGTARFPTFEPGGLDFSDGNNQGGYHQLTGYIAPVQNGQFITGLVEHFYNQLSNGYSVGNHNFGGGTTYAFDFLGAPEPSSWGLMLAGVGFVGARLRRRRHTVA